MGTDVKFFTNSNLNTPVLQNVQGSLLPILNACLVDGISVGAVSSISSVGNVATITFDFEHKLEKYQILKISGANESEFNGEHRITNIVNSHSISIELPSNPSTTTATGEIVADLPPLGWSKPFSQDHETAGGRAAYRSKNTALTCRPFLRVIDEPDPNWPSTYAKLAKVGIVEDMTGIDDLIGTQQPFEASAPDRNWSVTTGGAASNTYNGWAKWYYAKSGFTTSADGANTTITNGVRTWWIFGSGDYFYLVLGVGVATSETHYTLYGFGTFESFIGNDTYNAFLAANIVYETATSGSWPSYALAGSESQGYSRALRNYKGETGSSILYGMSINPQGSVIYSGANDRVASVATMGYVCYSNVFFMESGSIVRGKIPAINWLFQDQPVAHKTYLERDGEVLMALKVAMGSSQCMILMSLGYL